MKAVLGINVNPGHDTGAAIVVERDGRLQVFAISTERLDRVKHSRAFPQQAIDRCLQQAGCRLRDIDLIVAPYLLTASAADGDGVYHDPDLERKQAFFRMAEEFGVPVVFADHHLCHAASAYFSTDWEDAVALVIDGHGTSYETQSLFSCEGRQLTKLTASNQPGLGWMYSATTEMLLGFDRLQEGKTMGLAGWTDYGGVHSGHFQPADGIAGPMDTLYPQFVHVSKDGRWQLDAPSDLPRRQRADDPTAPPFVQYAFAAQSELERGVMQLVEYARQVNPDKRRLCFAGGVALNIPANRLIVDSGLFDEVFIQPAATDPGLPLGAALLGYYSSLGGTVRWRMEHAFLAGEYPAADMNAAVSRWSGARSPYKAEDLARILDNDYLVAWYQGASEFGPRALGHRSILCCPRDPNMKAYLNQEVKHREMFRPFAPIVPFERQSEFFDLALCTPYMLINATVLPEHAGRMPAVVHADGTARVQSIEQRVNPELHALLSAIGEINGLPVLLNTSLNLAGEPIVETPADALDLFARARLDVLVINGQILSKRPLIELMNTRNPGLREFAQPSRPAAATARMAAEAAVPAPATTTVTLPRPQYTTVGNAVAVGSHAVQPAVAPANEPDAFTVLETRIAATPAQQSVEPAALQAFHQWCRANVRPEEVNVEPAKVIAETPARALPKSLALMELLLALGRFELAVEVGEVLFGRYPMDHRVQDTLFRARLYRQNGTVSDRPGQELQGNYCANLWNTVHILPGGGVYQCCTVWLRTAIGNVFAQPMEEIWDGARARALRQSAIDGSYRYCGKLSCPYIQRRMLKSENAESAPEVWMERVPEELQPPKRFNLSYDRTCNLSCPSCRSEKIAAKGEEFEKIERVTDNLIGSLRRAERLEVTGSGDPFASKSFRRMLQAIDRKSYPDLKITIMTNGQLLRRSEWQKFEHLHGMIDCINVSVDGVKPETYRIVRRGGELADLIPNLEFIGELRRSGAIRYFRMCMVVQDINYREMPGFIGMAHRVGADCVHFQMMHDWETYDAAALKNRRVHIADHPDHGTFVATLKELRCPPGMQVLSDFVYLVPAPSPAAPAASLPERESGAPANHAAADADAFTQLDRAIAATPVSQSVPPEVLQNFHAWCRTNLKPADIAIDPAKILSETATRPLSQSLALMELLLALSRFDVAIDVGEQLFGKHPMDHRVQDTLMRSRMYRQTGRVSDFPGQEMKGQYCSHLWKTVNVLPDGAVHQCCSVWLRTSIGNVFSSDIGSIWRSSAAEEIRQSAINGDYRYCGKHSCPHLHRKMLGQPEADAVDRIWMDERPALPALPKRFNLAYDKTCNLSCPSCRTEQISAKGQELERIEQVTDGLMEALRQGERLEVTGSGDPFASKSFRRMLQSINRREFPNLKITIMTNGLLMKESEWQKFQHLHGMIDCVSVSVDAARADTYAVVRRGGDFDVLVPNLKFIGALRKSGAIKYYRLSFVTQDINFREMPAFIELAREVGADAVRFQMMHDWATYDGPTLRTRRIHISEHPMHGEFLSVLRSLPDPAHPQVSSDFNYLVDNSDSSSRDVSETRFNEVLKTLVERIRASAVDSIPSENYYVENVFPPDIYEQILKRLPPDDSYDFIEHPDAVLPDGTKTRKLLDLTPHTLARLPADDRRFWQSMTEMLSSEELQQAILDKFADRLAERFGSSRPPLVSVPLLYRDFPGYRIGVHTDAPYKVATMQFYFPRDRSQVHLGTSFYVKTASGFERYKTNVFQPNSAYGFVRTEQSWHGVEQMGPMESCRDTLALTIYVKGKEYRSDGSTM